MNPRALVCVVPTSPRLASRGRGHAHGGGWDFIGEEVKKKKGSSISADRTASICNGVAVVGVAWRGVGSRSTAVRVASSSSLCLCKPAAHAPKRRSVSAVRVVFLGFGVRMYGTAPRGRVSRHMYSLCAAGSRFPSHRIASHRIACFVDIIMHNVPGMFKPAEHNC